MGASVAESRRFPVLAKYEVLEELGHGGMATVYRARDRRLGREVAVKVIHPHLRDSAEVAHRFFVEAQAVAKLRHRNIVEVYDVSTEEESEQYLVCELVRGRTLRRILQEQKTIPPEVAACLALDVTEALGHAHAEGVVHRDVKPENVMIEVRLDAKVGEQVIVKLTDFGIAKLLDAKGVTSTGQVLGSPAHMAPEQIEGGEVDARADVFGLGVLLYEAMVGHLPFEGSNPAQVLRRVLDGTYPQADRERPEVGRRWSQILDHSLARDSAHRYSDARAMRDAIVAELERVGFGPRSADLGRWADSPHEFGESHAKAMATRLCELGNAARRSGDAVSAAHDYNRALAYSPHDPELLRLVSGVRQREARRRLVGRVAPLVGACLLFGAGAFAVTRAMRERDDSPRAQPLATDLPAPQPSTARGPTVSSQTERRAETVAPDADVLGLPVEGGLEEAGRREATSSTAGPTSRPVIPSIPAPPVKKSRIITITRRFPVGGVVVGVDGAAPKEVASLELDERAHRLEFACVHDMCIPQVREIPGGTNDESVEVRLAIRDAVLVLRADPTRQYRIIERPSVPVVVGGPTRISMTAGRDTLTLVELPEGPKARVRLQAGHETEFAFPR